MMARMRRTRSLEGGGGRIRTHVCLRRCGAGRLMEAFEPRQTKPPFFVMTKLLNSAAWLYPSGPTQPLNLVVPSQKSTLAHRSPLSR